jgi:hypothetical protein
MKVHNNLKELLADFSIYHHGWLLDENDIRTFTELTNDYLSANSLALGKPEPLAKNKQCDDDFSYCQTQIEGGKWCDEQCKHCKIYYAPLEKL